MAKIALKKCSFWRKLHFYGANLVAFGRMCYSVGVCLWRVYGCKRLYANALEIYRRPLPTLKLHLNSKRNHFIIRGSL